MSEQNGSAWLTTGEAARDLGMSRQRVYVLVMEERIPAAWVGGRYLIQRRDLRTFRRFRPWQQHTGSR